MMAYTPDDARDLEAFNRMLGATGSDAISLAEYRRLIERFAVESRARDAITIDSLSKTMTDFAREAIALHGNRHERRKNAALNRRR